MAKSKANGRNPDGTFAPGNSGGPGRPARRTETAYMLALADLVTVDDWHAIVKRAIDDAKNGDEKARAWLSRYLLGGNTLSAAIAIESTGVDALQELILLLMVGLMKNNAIDLALMQKLADWSKERRDGPKTNVDRLLENLQMDNIRADLDLRT